MLERSRLWTLAGIAAAAVAPQIARRVFGERMPKLENLSPQNVLERISIFKKRFETDKKFQERANAVVLNDKEKRTRVKFAQDAFLTTKANKFPASIQAKLAIIAPGIAAQESGFDASLVAKDTNAYGLWQVLPSHLKFINEIKVREDKKKGIKHVPFKLEEMNRMIQGTDFIFYSLDNYFYEEICVPAIEVAKRYRLDDKQAEDFGIYCMINAYNSGPTRMRNVLAAFQRNYPPRKVVGSYEFTPLSLFHAIAVFGDKLSGVSGYRQHSSEYVFKVLAGAEYLGYKNLDQAILKRTSPVFDDVLETVEDYSKTMAVGAGVMAAAKLARALTDPTSRRGLVRGIVKAAAAGAVVAGSAQYVNNNPESVKELLKFSWWNKTEQERGKQFKDGSVYSPKRVSEKFAGQFKVKDFLSANKFSADTVLPRRNYTREVIPFLEKVKLDFPNLDEASLDKAKKDSKYSTPQEVNNLWRMRGIGAGNVDTPINNMRYALVARDTENLLRQVTDKLQAELKTILPQGWFIRPIVNSLTRTKEQNAKIPGASASSAHMQGLSFDLSDTRFDIGYEEGGVKYFTELTNLTDSPAVNGRIITKMRQIISKILADTHLPDLNVAAPATGPKSIITYEPGARHYHITTRPAGK